MRDIRDRVRGAYIFVVDLHNTRLFGRNNSDVSGRLPFRIGRSRRRRTDKKAGALAVVGLAFDTGGERLSDGLQDGDHFSGSQARVVIGVAGDDGNLVGTDMEGRGAEVIFAVLDGFENEGAAGARVDHVCGGRGRNGGGEWNTFGRAGERGTLERHCGRVWWAEKGWRWEEEEEGAR